MSGNGGGGDDGGGGDVKGAEKEVKEEDAREDRLLVNIGNALPDCITCN